MPRPGPPHGEPSFPSGSFYFQTLNMHGFRDAILSRLVTMHQAPGASCGTLYYPGLVSCPFYAIPIYPF